MESSIRYIDDGAKKDVRPPDNFNQFLLIWLGQLVSVIGSGLTAFTLGIYVFNLTGTATSYALTILCAFLPSFILSPFAGVLADRYDRRLLIVIGDLGAAIGVGYILTGLWFGQLEIWQIYLGVAISSAFSAVHAPSYKATVTDMLPPQRYEQASGLVQLAGSAQYLISPLIAGVLISILDIQYILIIDLLSFAFAIFTVLTVRKRLAAFYAVEHGYTAEQHHVAQRKEPFFSEMRQGFLSIVANKGILSLVGLTALVLFFVGLLQALFGPMVLSFSDAKTFGSVQSACAFGMLFSSLLIGIFGVKKDLVLVLSLSLGAMGLFFALLGLSTQIIWIVVPGFLFFFSIPFINTSIDVLLRNTIDKTQQGRVWSFISVMTYSGAILAYCCAGFLADRIFNPLFISGGFLADSMVAGLIGSGAGRGIAFMLLLSGLCIMPLGYFTFKAKRIRILEQQLKRQTAITRDQLRQID